jgi:outer membrane protein assembly factor BamB/subtilisin family serine protease
MLVNDTIVVKFKSSVPHEGPKSIKTLEEKAKKKKASGFQTLDKLIDKFEVSDLKKQFNGAAPPKNPKKIDLSRNYKIKFPKKFDPLEVAAEYAKDPNVEYAEVIDIVSVEAVYPNDTYFYSQWGLNYGNGHDIDAPEAWDYCRGTTEVVVAVIDTGVDWHHPDLGGTGPDYIDGNIWVNWPEYYGTPGVDDDGNGYIDDIRGWDFVDGVSGATGEDTMEADNDPSDFHGHGTHCSGIIGAIANNGIGVSGVNWRVKVMPLRTGWVAPGGGGYLRLDWCAEAIYYAASKEATAVSCSWTSANSGGIAAAVTYATQEGTLVVVAGGNANSEVPYYLGSRGDCIDVAATDWTDKRAGFSNYGSWVDVSAPGVTIYSTYFDRSTGNHTYVYMSGTSMATPFVAGLAGLIKSFKPSLTGEEIRSTIINCTNNIDPINLGFEGKLGEGRINAFLSMLEVTGESSGTGRVTSNPNDVPPGSTGNITFTLQGKLTTPINKWEISIPSGWTVNSSQAQIQSSLISGCATATANLSGNILTIEGCNIDRDGTYNSGSFTINLTAPSVRDVYTFSSRTAKSGGTLITLYSSLDQATVKTTGGYIAGTILIYPEAPVSIEIEASQNGSVKGSMVRAGSGTYVIGNLDAGAYSLEAHASGYEIVMYPAAIEVSSDITSEAINITLRSAWPAFKQDKLRSGNCPRADIYPPLSLKWSFGSSGYIESSAALLNSTIYVGSNDNRLYAIREDGSQKWSFEAGGPVRSSPVTAYGAVYFGSNDCKLYAVADNGTQIWSFLTGGAVKSSPVVSNGIIYAGSSDSKLYAVRSDGTFKWSFSLGGDIDSSPAVSNGIVYMGSGNNKMYAIKDNGAAPSLLWSFATAWKIYSSPAIDGSALYFGSGDGKLYAVDLSGTQRWSFATAGPIKSSPSVSNGTVYVGSSDNKLYALNSDGSLKWSLYITSAVDSSPAIVDEILYVGTKNGKLFAIKDNGATCTILWTYSCGGEITASPSTLNRTLYIGSGDNNLYAFETPASSISGYISLIPFAAVSIEVTAYQRNGVKARVSITGSGPYTLGGLLPGDYHVEAAAPGYEIKSYGPVTVFHSSTINGINIDLTRAWPLFKQDRWQSGYSPDKNITLPLSLKWSYDFSAAVMRTPAVSHGKVFVATDNGNCYAFDENTHSLLWSYHYLDLSYGYQANASMTAAYGKVFLTSIDARGIRALDENTGALLWTCADGNSSLMPPVCGNGRIYAPMAMGLIGAFDQNDGSTIWTYFAGDADISSSIAMANGKLFFSSHNLTYNTFYAINEDDGSFLWSYRANLSESTSWRSETAPCASKSLVFMSPHAETSGLPGLFAFDQETGELRWSASSPIRIGNPVVGGGKVFTGIYNYYALDENTGAVMWSRNSDVGTWSSPAIANGYLFVGSAATTYEFFALDENDGSLEWSFHVLQQVFSSPAIANGRAYVGTGWATIYPGQLLVFGNSSSLYIVSQDPFDGKLNTDIHTSVEVTFSEPMDKTSVEAAASMTPTAAGSFSWSSGDTKAKFTPTDPLKYFTTYVVTISATAQDTTGNRLASDEVFKFTTARIADVQSFTATRDANGGILYLSWTNPSAYDFSGVIVRWSTAEYPASPAAGELLTDEASSGGSSSSFVHSGLINGQRHYYKAFTYDSIPTYSGGAGVSEIPMIGAPPTTDFLPPNISKVKFNGKAYVAGDVIQQKPTITASIEDSESGVSTIEIRANGRILYHGTTLNGWIDGSSQGNASYEAAGAFEYNLTASPLASPPVNYTITLEALDLAGNSTQQILSVKTYASGSAKVVGEPVSYPSVFKPLSGGKLLVGYTLTTNSDITIYFYDISGNIVLTKKFSSGRAGGSAGYNQMEWDGTTDFRKMVGNGIFIYKITSGSKVLATGKVVVYD